MRAMRPSVRVGVVMSGGVEGLRSANWIVQDRVLATAHPTEAEMARLAELGITTLIALLEHPPAQTPALKHGIVYRHLTYHDMTPPAEELIREFVSLVDMAVGRGEKVAVHCMAGLGRTGTLLSCYMVHRGMGAEEAIRYVRGRRPGSVQTRAQELAVRRYADVELE